jgi:uncharacterized membrane protein
MVQPCAHLTVSTERTPMADRNLALLVATYEDDTTTTAAADYAALKELDDVAVLASVVLARQADGTVGVTEHGGGLVGKGTTIGALSGFVVGLFAPPLLAVTAVGAGIGAAAGAIAKHHDEKKIGLDADEWLPANSSAIVAVVDDRYLDRVDKAVQKATKKVDKAIDKGDYEAVAKALDEGGAKILDAIES